jgi:hypothetical protein
LVRLFAPELRANAYEQEIMTGIPLPIGPTVLDSVLGSKGIPGQMALADELTGPESNSFDSAPPKAG